MATKKKTELKTYNVNVTAEVSCMVEVQATSWKDAAAIAEDRARNEISVKEEGDDEYVTDVSLDWNTPTEDQVEEE